MSSKASNFQIFSRLIRLARPWRKALIGSLLLAMLLAPAAALRPYFIQKLVDEYIYQFDLHGIETTIYILLGLLTGESLMRYGFTFLSNWLAQSVIRDLRVKVFDHFVHLRPSYFDKTPIGTATTRTINDVETIATVFSEGALTIVSDLLMVLAVLVVMFWSSWQLALISLGVMPLLLLATYFFKEGIKHAFRQVRSLLSKMNAFLQEHISGMRIVQIFTAEKQEFEKFNHINQAYTNANLKALFYYAIFFPAIEIFSALALGSMLWWGSRGVLGGSITLGALVAFPLYLSMLFRPMRFLADRFNTVQMGLIAAGRVFAILDTRAYISNEGKLQATKLQGALRFERVYFSYDGEHEVLHDLSFHIKPGQTVALVGSTGSGKTTIVHLINRFYEIQKGRICIDGRDIREYELKSLRSRIAMVPQDVFLFTGTVFENITLRDPSITPAQVEHAAKMIGAHEFIMRLPKGYDFEVMERGARLSVGQRQLISFVRALVFEPDILILDEATSSIDPESEAIIQYAVEKLIAKRTSIIIAHRLATILHADNILVLERGRLVEQGKHHQLLQKEDGAYKKLYQTQFAELTKNL